LGRVGTFSQEIRKGFYKEVVRSYGSEIPSDEIVCSTEASY